MGQLIVQEDSEELDLIAKAAKGDREAFGQLYEKCVAKVFRHIYYLTGDRLAAEDITAQTFLKALEAIHRYQVRGSPFLAWLLRIAYNLTINYKKAKRNSTPLQLSRDMKAKGSLYSPEESWETKNNLEDLWAGVRRLREDQRQVLVMRFIDGLSYPDIAQVLGKSVGSVRVIQHRAVARLRRLWEEEHSSRTGAIHLPSPQSRPLISAG